MNKTLAGIFAVLCLFLTACGADTKETKSSTVGISCAVLCDRQHETQVWIPEDGWLLQPTEVSFTQGESAFDVLVRTCREAGIHLEFSKTPGYGSAYVEGIGNLYEFDFGTRSGWTYSVGGTFPNLGCSAYILQDGDEICWHYTCDLGADLK